MTEKQGGSDVRANTTRARRLGAAAPARVPLTGHKWFCSAPMSDAFLVLRAGARAACPVSCCRACCRNGTRNDFALQRLKDKLGNRSNASSEVELSGALA